jgi:uncharacterized protein (DUF433 family)
MCAGPSLGLVGKATDTDDWPWNSCNNDGNGQELAMKWQDYIEERHGVMLGKPTFKGTRLTVQHVLEELGGGMTVDDLLANYPTLKPEHIQAALQYAAAVVGMDQSIYE